MNVMHVDTCPRAAALQLPDQHVNKLATESAQMLSTVAHLRGVWHDGLYRPTHVGHRCVRQADNDSRALHWLLEHGLALVVEHRWRHRRPPTVHQRAEQVLQAAAQALGMEPGVAEAWRGAPVALAMDDDLRAGQPDPVVAYRAWIRRKVDRWDAAGRPARYTRRQPPGWLGACLARVVVRP